MRTNKLLCFKVVMARIKTLKIIRMQWLEFYDFLSPACLIFGVIATGAGYLFDVHQLKFAMLIALVGSAFFYFFEDYFFYDLVKCPKCKEKLNVFKNGNRVPDNQAWNQLSNDYGCRHCGWKPSEK